MSLETAQTVNKIIYYILLCLHFTEHRSIQCLTCSILNFELLINTQVKLITKINYSLRYFTIENSFLEYKFIVGVIFVFIEVFL